jgi:hypothetical protein
MDNKNEGKKYTKKSNKFSMKNNKILPGFPGKQIWCLDRF